MDEIEKGCKCCRDGERILLNDNTDICIPIDRAIPQIKIEGETFYGKNSYCVCFKINFCPICGSLLKEGKNGI